MRVVAGVRLVGVVTVRSHGRIVVRQRKKAGRCLDPLDDGHLGAAEGRAGVDDLGLRPLRENSGKCHTEWDEKRSLLHRRPP